MTAAVSAMGRPSRTGEFPEGVSPMAEADATAELEALAEEHPEDVRSLAAKADEPIKSRLLRLLDDAGGGQ